MTSNEEMVFDPKCGIPEEEQREIFAQINGIAEKNRLSLSAEDSGTGKGKKKNRFKAKKSGGLFPVLVNIAAIAALAGGFFALYTFQEKTDAEVREGTKVYNIAERALIEEIRRETSSRLEAKENEISRIISQLEEVDTELRNLHSSQELTAEQQAAEDRLKSLQEEYRSALSLLQDERSRILEDARAREAELQVQLERRTSELALVAEQSAAAIDSARGELERLSREQAQVAAVEAQMGAFFANLNDRISENRLEEAAGIIASMKNFLNTPAFQSLRSMQARKELYTQSVNSFDNMVDELRRNQAALATGIVPLDRSAEALFAELQERNAQLERDIEEKDKTLEAFSSEGSGMARRLRDLQTANRTLEANSTAKDRQISNLNNEVTRLTQSAETSRRDATTSQQTAANLQTANETLTQTVRTRDNTITELRQQNAERDNAITELRRQNTDQGETIESLNTQLTSIRQALQALTQ